jgi:hypothetical protein
MPSYSPCPITWWLLDQNYHAPLRFETYELSSKYILGIPDGVDQVGIDTKVSSVGYTRSTGSIINVRLLEVQSYNDSLIEIGTIITQLVNFMFSVITSYGEPDGEFTGLIREVLRIPAYVDAEHPGWLQWVTMGLVYSRNGYLDLMGPEPSGMLRVEPSSAEWAPIYDPPKPAPVTRVSRYNRAWVI